VTGSRPVSNPEDRLPMPPEEDEPTNNTMTLDDRWRRQLELGRARWVEQMRSQCGYILCSIYPDEAHWDWFDGKRNLVDGVDVGEMVPDWTNDANIASLLSQAREAWDDSKAFVMWRSGSWVFCTINPLAPHLIGSTEAEALIAAREAAP